MAENDTTEIDQLASEVENIKLAPSVKESLTTTVLSWNINGPGKAEPRKQMLKTVIKKVNPDVMLLQETKKSIVEFLENNVITEKDYISEAADDKEEAMVIYKKDVFEKVDSSPVNLDKVLKKVIPENETISLKDEKVPVRSRIKERSCVVHLRHILTKREIIFVSYHNIRKGGGDAAVIDMATRVCKIIDTLHKSTKCCVIAGVDFNCSGFDKTPVKVLDYTSTPRRKSKAKVDYYILKKSTENWKEEKVNAYDLFPGDKTKLFERHEKKFTLDEYKKALDHDPLVLPLSVQEEEEEEEEEEE